MQIWQILIIFVCIAGVDIIFFFYSIIYIRLIDPNLKWPTN